MYFVFVALILPLAVTQGKPTNLLQRSRRTTDAEYNCMENTDEGKASVAQMCLEDPHKLYSTKCTYDTEGFARCSSFIQCVHDHYYVHNCPGVLEFNPPIQVCDWSFNIKNYKCKESATSAVSTEAPTEAPTDPPTTTQAPTDPPTTTQEPTDPPATTQEPTDPPTTTQEPTDPPTTTQEPTDPPTTTPEPTDPPTTTPEPTDPPTTTPEPTDPPTTTPEPTDPPTTTPEPTDPPTTTPEPTDPPTTTPEPTDPPTTTPEPTDPPANVATTPMPFVQVRSEGCGDPGKVTAPGRPCGTASILVNGNEESPMNRGFNIVAIDRTTSLVTSSASFDTHGDRDSSKALADYIGNIPDGSIIALATQDEAFYRLSEDAKLAISSIGGASIRDMLYRGSYALISYKGASGSPAGLPIESVNVPGKGPTTVSLA